MSWRESRGAARTSRRTCKPGDVIDGYVEGQGRLVELSSALDIHYAAAARKPGQTLSLRRRRDGQGAQDVALLLGQAIDERKPLLTLFVARAGARGSRLSGWPGTPSGRTTRAGRASHHSSVGTSTRRIDPRSPPGSPWRRAIRSSGARGWPAT